MLQARNEILLDQPISHGISGKGVRIQNGKGHLMNMLTIGAQSFGAPNAAGDGA